MEVFFGSTPTYSGNYKANLETFPDEYISDTPKELLLIELGIALSVERNT
jgi:hypothetical protein